VTDWAANLGRALVLAGALQEAFERGYYEGSVDTVTGRAREFWRKDVI
jgi:hypothetical protein